MVRLDPRTLYSKSDLQELLGEQLSVDTFLARLRPTRRFKNLYWGQDLLDALAKCPPLDEEYQPEMPTSPKRKEVKNRAQDHSDSNRLSVSEVLARRK